MLTFFRKSTSKNQHWQPLTAVWSLKFNFRDLRKKGLEHTVGALKDCTNRQWWMDPPFPPS